MAIAQRDIPASPLSFEEYLAEGEVDGRYDIIDGRRLFMPGPTRGHQRISKNLTRALLSFEELVQKGQMYYAPLDILIRRFPLQVRQPDLLFLSNERASRAAIQDDSAYLEIAPELTIEILSGSDRKQVITDKLADYAAIGVSECWLVRPNAETVEVLTLTGQKLAPVATYGQGQNVISVVFPDLIVSVAEIFAD